MDLIPEQAEQAQGRWLNRNVAGMGLTSLLSDIGHEMVTAILPGFLTALGLSAAVLGMIEGVADGATSVAKLAAGWLSDRPGRRKATAVGGYFLTGGSVAIFAFAFGWPLVLVGRVVGWFGRGIRGPARNTILAASVPPQSRGKAFGFERAGDTLGAIIGPLIAVWLLGFFHSRATEPASAFRLIFLLALVPGVGSGISFALLVKDVSGAGTRAKFFASLRQLPRSFRNFLVGVGVFGLGDFAHTLMILAATQLLVPGQGIAHAARTAALLYVAHNVVYAATSYPVGALSDQLGRRGLLALGYLSGTLTALGFVAAFIWHLATIPYLLALFAVGGFYVGFEESLEGSITADLATAEARGTAYGVLGAVNGVGDVFASFLVGYLWTAVSPAAAFGYAAAVMCLGGLFVYRLR